MNLEKSFLENILCGRPIAQLTLQKTEQFGLMAPDEQFHRLPLTCAVRLHELFVGSLVHVCSQGPVCPKLRRSRSPKVGPNSRRLTCGAGVQYTRTVASDETN